MAITTDQVKELRERTGISVMQCKRALEEAGGDMEKALVILRKESSRAAEKKSDRELGAGVVQAYVHGGGDIGAMVLLSAETDFVAKNKEFVDLAYNIAMHVAAANPRFLKREEVTDEDMKAAREVFEKEAAEKPAEMREKIVSGKMDSYLKDQVLLEQEYIKEPGRTIGFLLQEAVQKFGERVELTSFVRFSARG